MNIRKTVYVKEIITSDEMGRACDPITRVAAMVVVKNPFAGVDQEDLSDLFQVSATLGPSLTQELVSMLPAPPVCYGKAAHLSWVRYLAAVKLWFLSVKTRY